MEKTQYNGPEMTAKKVVVLLLTASVILVLFLTRTVKSEAEPEIETSWQQVERSHTYISPYDSLFRQYADSVCDWKMLAAIAYVESKFDTAAVSGSGARGLMQIMPATYSRMLARMGVRDTSARSIELDIRVAVRYLDELNSTFSFISDGERMNYILGSYNGGPSHIFDAMRIARKNGQNRYSWCSLTPVIMSLSDPAVYNDSVCRSGCFYGTETLQYVSRVNRKYNEYRRQELLFQAIEKLAENNRNEIHHNN